MREILFRAKTTGDGRWIYGSLLVEKQDNSEVNFISNDEVEKTVYIQFEKNEWGRYTNEYGRIAWCCVPRKKEVAPETVGQYTGLTDKNGKRIFEGDIIKTHYANTPKADFIEQVVFHNGRFCGMYEHDKMKMWATLADGIKHLPQDKSVYMEWCEIIGNIHDNLELMKAKKAKMEG